MPQTAVARVNVQRNISINQEYFTNAVKRTNVKSRKVFKQIVKEMNSLTPQQLGKMARRIDVASNQTKTAQDRFVEIFA
ncbi:hypothetical protein ACFL7D_05215 [candidate division KSB1 bacterium]